MQRTTAARYETIRVANLFAQSRWLVHRTRGEEFQSVASRLFHNVLFRSAVSSKLHVKCPGVPQRLGLIAIFVRRFIDDIGLVIEFRLIGQSKIGTRQVLEFGPERGV